MQEGWGKECFFHYMAAEDDWVLFNIFFPEFYSTKENREGQRKHQDSFCTILEPFSTGNSEMIGANNRVYRL